MDEISKVKPIPKALRRLYKFLVVLGIILLIIGMMATYYLGVERYEPKVYGEKWSVNDEFDINKIKSVTIKGDELKILQLADQQMVFFTWTSDTKTVDLLTKTLDAEKPDICVSTGDLFLSLVNDVSLRQFCQFMEDREQYWTFTFGNHDSEYGLNKYAISNILAKYPHCLYSVGPDNIKGKGNYFVNIKKGNEIVYTLCMMDSNMYPPENTVGGTVFEYDWIGEDQIVWYDWAVKGFQKTLPNLQSMAFFHIGLLEIRDLYDTGIYTGKVDESQTEENPWGMYPQGKNTGLYDKMLELNSTKAVFFGHDHMNTIRGWYNKAGTTIAEKTATGSGIYLAYGKGGGYHTYPFFEKPNFLTDLLGLSDTPMFNAEFMTNGRGILAIRVNTKTGAFSTHEYLHKNF